MTREQFLFFFFFFFFFVFFSFIGEMSNLNIRAPQCFGHVRQGQARHQARVYLAKELPAERGALEGMYSFSRKTRTTFPLYATATHYDWPPSEVFMRDSSQLTSQTAAHIQEIVRREESAGMEDPRGRCAAQVPPEEDVLKAYGETAEASGR